MKHLTKLTLVLFLSVSAPCAHDWVDLDTQSSDQLNTVRDAIKTDPNLVLALYQITYDTSQLLEKHEVPYSLAFGSLLGAVRNKGIIPHDDDVDLMIDTKDGEKLMALKDTFWILGYDLFKDPEKIVGYKLYSRTPIKLTTGKEVLPFIDLFEFGLNSADCYSVLPSEGQKLFGKAQILAPDFQSTKLYQFGSLMIRGLSNPAPFLNAFYGQSWKSLIVVSHKHNSTLEHNYLWKAKETDLQPAQPTGPLKERVKHFFETRIAPAPLAANNSSFWNNFYSKQNLEVTPSTFAVFLAKNNYITPGETLVDIATGNGRDTFFFLQFGMKATGIDASTDAIRINQTKISDPNSFQVVDINDQPTLSKFLDHDYFYARFFIHSISEAEQNLFINFLSTMKIGGKLLLEFRTDKDPMFTQSSKVSKNEGVTNHYRRYINFAEFCQTLENLGFRIDYRHESDNLSVRDYDDPILGHVHDDPWLGRIVATKL